jgi:hypothetical protein
MSKRLGSVKAGEKLRIVGYKAPEHYFIILFKKKAAYVDASGVQRTDDLQALITRTLETASGRSGEGAAGRLDNRTAKLQVLTLLYGEKAAKKMMEGKTWVGMTMEMVIQTLGEPKRRKRVDFSNIIKEHWEFPDGLDLYFENGILKAIGGLPPGVQPLEPPGVPPGKGCGYRE